MFLKIRQKNITLLILKKWLIAPLLPCPKFSQNLSDAVTSFLHNFNPSNVLGSAPEKPGGRARLQRYSQDKEKKRRVTYLNSFSCLTPILESVLNRRYSLLSALNVSLYKYRVINIQRHRHSELQNYRQVDLFNSLYFNQLCTVMRNDRQTIKARTRTLHQTRNTFTCIWHPRKRRKQDTIRRQ